MNIEVLEDLNSIKSQIKDLNQEFYDKEKFTEKLKSILQFQPFNEEIYINLTNLLFKYGKSLSKQGKCNKQNLYHEIIIDDCLYKLSNCFKENNFIMIKSLKEIIEKKGFSYLKKTENWKKLKRVNIQLAKLHKRYDKLDLVISYYKNALKYSEKIGNKESISFLFEKIRKIYYQMENSEAGIEDFNNIDDLYSRKKPPFITGLAKKEIGNLFNYMEYYDLALTNYQVALNFFEKYNYINEVLRVKEKIGILLFKQKNFNDAIEYFKFIIDFERKEGKRENINSLFDKTSFYYKKLDKIEEAIENFEKFYHSALVKDYNIVAGYVKKTIGRILSKQGNYIASIQSFKEAIVCFEKEDFFNELASVEMKIGNLFFHQKRYKDAENHYNLTFYYNKKIDNYIGCAISQIKLAKTYNFQKKFIKYLRALLNSSKFDFINRRWVQIAKTYVNIGNYNLNKGRVNKSINFYLISIYFHKREQRWDQVAITYLTIGNIFEEQNKYKRSIRAYLKSIKYCKKDKNCDRITETYIKIGNVLSKRGDFKEAIKYYETSRDILLEVDKLEDLGYIYSKLGESYSKLNNKRAKKYNYLMVFVYYKKYINLLEVNDEDQRLGYYYYRIAEVCTNLNNFSLMEKYYEKSIEKNRNYGFLPEAAQTCLIMADFHYKRDNYNKALKYCEFAIEYDNKASDIEGIAVANSKKGDILTRLGKFREAIEFYIISLEYNRQKNDHRECAILEIKIGDVFSKQANIIGAIEYYKEAIEDNKLRREWSLVAALYSKIGEIYYQRMKFNKALLQFKEAIKIDYKNNDLNGLAIVNIKIGNIKYELNDIKATIMHYRGALRYNKVNANWDYVAQTYAMIGQLFTQLGETKKAFKNLEKAIKFNEKIENWEGYNKSMEKLTFLIHTKEPVVTDMIKSLENAIKADITKKSWKGLSKKCITCGDIYLRLKNYELARKYYKNALDNDKTHNFLNGIAISHLKLGELYSAQGLFNKARKHINMSLKIDKKMGNLKGISINYIRIGDIYFKQKEFYFAQLYYKRALDHDVKHNNSRGICISNLKLGELYSSKGNYRAALIRFQNALVYDIEFNQVKRVSITSTKIGNIHVQLGNYNEAIKSYNEALNADLELGNIKGIVISCSKIAKVYSIMDNYKEALKYYKIALTHNIDKGDELRKYMTQIKIASLYLNQRLWGEALKHYNDVLDYLLKIKSNDFFYFKIQALRCEARLAENRGDYEEVASIHLEIADNYKQLERFIFYGFHNLLHELFKTELISQKGEHEKCLERLIDLEKRLEFFLKDLEDNPMSANLKNLMRFRYKQVKAHIMRENAFISAEKGNYDDASVSFKTCADIYKELIPKKYQLDYLLYKAISDYYLGHSNWYNFKKFCRNYPNNYKDQLQFLHERVLNPFKDAEEKYGELNQTLRKRDISYEILLIEGKMAIINNEMYKAQKKHEEAQIKLMDIDSQKAEEFSKTLKSIKDLRQFPTGEFFLRIPSKGSSFIGNCKLSIHEWNKDNISLNINLPSPTANIKEDYKFSINIQINIQDIGIQNILEEYYFVKFIQTNEKKKFAFDEEDYSRLLNFVIPYEKESCKKEYQIELLDSNKNCITDKTFPLKWQDKFIEVEDHFSKLVFEVFRGDNFTEIIKLIDNERFNDILENLDIIYNSISKTKIRIIIEIFKEIITAFIASYKFEFSIVKSIYARIINKINIDINSLQQEDQLFFKEIKERYIYKILNLLKNYFKALSTDPNIQNIHPIIFETKNYNIESNFNNKKYTLLLLITVAFLEKIMNRILLQIHNKDYNNFDWSGINKDDYRELYSKETGYSKETTPFKNKLEFLSAKCVLMLLNNEFRDFCEQNTRIFSIIRLSRNKSPYEHGSIPADEKIANSCIELMKNLKKYKFSISLFDFPGFFDNQINLIKDFIEYLNKNFIIQDVDDTMDENRSITKKIDDLTNKFENLKIDIKSDHLDLKVDHQYLKDTHLEITYEIRDLNKEINEFKNNFENPYIIEEFIKFFIDTNRDKKLPPLKEVRVTKKEDRKALKKAIQGWFNQFWLGIKRRFRLERPLVFVFNCENENCSHPFRFIYYEKTKIAKIGMILLKMGALTESIFRFISKYDRNFSVWVFQDGEFKLESLPGIKKKITNLTPSEIQFLYRFLFGIEDENSKSLSETFRLIHTDGKIKFYCNKCMEKIA